jgi:hypothetical protein
VTSAEVLFAERHRDEFDKIQANAVALSTAAWDSLGDWTSPGAADEWANLWLPINDAAVETVTTATDAYFSMVTEEAALDLTGLTAAELRGVTAEEYARRPLVTVYTELGKGAWWADAVQAGRDRVAAMASMDASLAQRNVADEWVSGGKVAGYRRTLTGASCVLCAVASTQRYHRKNLMELHSKCDCGVAPINGADDPGQVINDRLLDKLKGQDPAIWDRPYGLDEDGRLRLRKTEIVRDSHGDPVINKDTGKPRTRMVLGDEVTPKVTQHGELGPVLEARPG